MMRILCLSDTHGNLSIINDLIEKEDADAVIHAGDFGFQSKDQLDRLSGRELYLEIKHNRNIELNPGKTAEIRHWTKAQKIDFIHDQKLYSEYQEFLEGNKAFLKPVYCVWGNHEDIEIVRGLENGEINIPNLFVLAGNSAYVLNDSIYLCGLGGNFIQNRLFLPSLSGKGGKVYSSMSDFADLFAKAKNQEKRIWFVSHVSPGKELLLEYFIQRLQPEVSFSGHTGAPVPLVYNHFGLHDINKHINTGEQQFHQIEAVYKYSYALWNSENSQSEQRKLIRKFESHTPDNTLSPSEEEQLKMKCGLQLFEPIKMSINDPNKTLFINLPDASLFRYVVLEIGDDDAYSMTSRGCF